MNWTLMKGIIPTGGRGTRMRPITFSANKHFIPVGNKPLIHYPIEAVVAAGVKDIGITYNPGYLELAKKYLGTGSKWSAKFTYILQPQPIGLANIVEVCEEFVGANTFIFHLGDNIFTDGVKTLADTFRRDRPNGLVATIHHKENHRLGVPYFDKKGRLVKLVEKPKKPPHDLAIAGVYFADANFFRCFRGRDRIKPSMRGEYEIPDAFQWLIDHSFRVEAHPASGRWLDPGKFDDWLETNQYLLDLQTQAQPVVKVSSDVRIEGRVRIGKMGKIRNSTIRGPVSIADRVTIIDSFIGPYTSIDREVAIIKCRIENSVVMEKVRLEGITKPIDNSIIGSGTHVTNGIVGHDTIELFVGELARIRI